MANDQAFDKVLCYCRMERGASVWTNQRQNEAATAHAVAFVIKVLTP